MSEGQTEAMKDIEASWELFRQKALSNAPAEIVDACKWAFISGYAVHCEVVRNACGIGVEAASQIAKDELDTPPNI